MSKLNEFLQAERQARKESSMVCGCLEELDTLFNSKTKSGNLAYGLYMRLLSNGLLTPVTSDSKPLTYRFYDGLVNFSIEIDNSLVKFKDYYGSLEIPQPQLLQYANVIHQLLLVALSTKVM